MTDPLSLETILAEFSEDAEAWVLQDKPSAQFVFIPHPKFPGRRPVQFFLSHSDAEAVLTELLDVNKKLRKKDIFPVKVKLLQTARAIAGKFTENGLDGFVVHSPNEVYEFIRKKNDS